VLILSSLREAVRHGNQVKVINKTKGETYATVHMMTERQVEMVLAGSLINLMRERHNQ
jgi:aconitate hydratase